MKRKNRIKIVRLALCFLVALMCLLVKMQDVHATNWWNVVTETPNDHSIKLSWKQKNVTRIVVERYKGTSQSGKAKKTVVLSGGAVSYLDEGLKSNKDYTYCVTGYAKKKGKEVAKFCGQAYTSTKVASAVWDDYQTVSGNHDVNYIDLNFGLSEGIKPEGIDVFRKKVGSDEDYKVIATVAADAEKYRDETVETYVSYKYKLEPFILENGEKVYAIDNYAVTMTAVKANPEYDINININPKEKTMVLELTSLPGNADTVFGGRYLDDTYLNLKKKGAKKAKEVYVQVTEYSYDNVTWKKFNEKSEQVLSCGGTIYIKLENYALKDKYNPNIGAAKKLNFYDENVMLKGIENIGLYYNDRHHLGYLNTKKNVFTAGIDGEQYS